MAPICPRHKGAKIAAVNAAARSSIEISGHPVFRRWAPEILLAMKADGRRFNELLRDVPGLSKVGLTTRLRELMSAGLVEHGSVTRRATASLPESGRPGTEQRRTYMRLFMRKRRASRRGPRSAYGLTSTGFSYIEPLGSLAALTGGLGRPMTADVISLEPVILLGDAKQSQHPPAAPRAAQSARAPRTARAPRAAQSARAPIQLAGVIKAERIPPPFDLMTAAIDFRPMLLRKACELYNGNLSDAQDAVGDVLLKLCSKPPQPRTPNQLHHWLRTVLKRQHIDRYRKRTSRLVLVEEIVSLDVMMGWTG